MSKLAGSYQVFLLGDSKRSGGKVSSLVPE